jgi:hypothetical protein
MSFPTPPTSQPDGYHAYLMRLWQAGSDGTWRVSLQCAQTGEKIHFAGLESLFTYLQAQTIVDDERAGKVIS